MNIEEIRKEANSFEDEHIPNDFNYVGEEVLASGERYFYFQRDGTNEYYYETAAGFRFKERLNSKKTGRK